MMCEDGSWRGELVGKDEGGAAIRRQNPAGGYDPCALCTAAVLIPVPEPPRAEFLLAGIKPFSFWVGLSF